MSTPLPTEEDVLAHLVLHAARPITTDVDSTAQTMERIAWNAAMAASSDELLRDRAIGVLAMERLRTMGTVEDAIADSERRWVVEVARDAVVEAARAWGISIFAGNRSNGDLLAAVCVLEAAEMGVR